MDTVSASIIRELLNYDPATGMFMWRVRKQGRFLRPFRGTFSGRYLKIKIDGREHYAHRLAWVCATGVWPEGDLDHVNEIKTDNRFENLRVATRSQNTINISAPNRGNRSGHRGVTLHHTGKWRATFQGRHLGLSRTAEEAAAMYATAKREAQK